MAQLKQRLVEVWADFEQTIVNQWSKRLGFVKYNTLNTRYLSCGLCEQMKCFKQL